MSLTRILSRMLEEGGGSGAGIPVVRTVFTTNVNRSGEKTNDGVTTSADPVLVAGQTNPAENGLYLTGPAGWSRLSGFGTMLQLQGVLVLVAEGTVHEDEVWLVSADPAGTLNTDPISVESKQAPLASQTAAGLIKTATAAQAADGLSEDVALTPAALSTVFLVRRGSLGDNVAAVLATVPANSVGFGVVMMSTPDRYALFRWRAYVGSVTIGAFKSGPDADDVVSGDPDNVAFMVGQVTGSIGTDGKTTIAMSQTNLGRLSLENRAGGSAEYLVVLFLGS